MAEDLLLKFAQPLLIGIGLIVVLSAGTLISILWSIWQSRDSRLEKLEGLVIKLVFETEQNQKDLNNIGQMVRELRNGRQSL